MSRREKEELTRAHFWIFKRDHERLRAHFHDNVGMSKAVRSMIHNYLNQVELKAQQSYNQTDQTKSGKQNVQLDLIDHIQSATAANRGKLKQPAE